MILLNRDTLYSFGVFDLDASPLSITLPDPGKRYMAVQVINGDHYTPDVFYAPGSHLFTREKVGTRYVCLAIRTFINPNDQTDIKAAHSLQDAISTGQKSPGEFAEPLTDEASLKKIRDALPALGTANGGLDSSRMFGPKDQVDPVQHLLGTPPGWGGNPSSAALYVGVDPRENDGRTVYTLTMRDIPVHGFWSISVYNKGGYFEKNALNSYAVNDVSGKPNDDGSITIHFGGDVKMGNYWECQSEC